MNAEEWRLVVDHTDYEVSNFGNVRRRTPQRGTRPGKPVKARPQNSGHLQLSFRVNKTVRVFRYIHRLVAEAFIGPIEDGHEINHIDGNPTNNKLENLEIVTHKENILHAFRILKRRRAPARLTVEDIEEMRRLVSAGAFQKDVASRFGCERSYVSMVCGGHRRIS